MKKKNNIGCLGFALGIVILLVLVYLLGTILKIAGLITGIIALGAAIYFYIKKNNDYFKKSAIVSGIAFVVMVIGLVVSGGFGDDSNEKNATIDDIPESSEFKEQQTSSSSVSLESSESTDAENSSSDKGLSIQLEKKELISDSNGKVIIKGKTKPDARVSVGMGIVGDSTTAGKDGTFELTHELTNAKPEELVINASLDDLSTSETINVKPSEEAKKQEENNNDITKLSKEPTTEQQAILDNLAKQQFEELYPYKGSKMHSILGNIQSWTQNNGSWYKKVEATIVNAYGAERSTTIEIHITPQSPSSGIVEIIEY